MTQLRILFCVPIVVVSLAACGGSGDGTSGPSGPTTEGHRIAVAITGLLGSGTAVQLNGANDQLPLATNTALYFTDVRKGTQYTITVKTQPSDPWQTCVIANGTGTMGSSDIDVPSMTCTTNAYKVRGAISGLTAAGLSLANGSGTPVAIAPGATTFEFSGILSNVDFAVKIASQPSGQTCALNNGSGTVTNADVTNLTLTCGAPGFTVGGSASGLGSNGLALSLNGATPLSVAAQAAAFTFPAALQNGDEYGVAITSMPQNSGTANFRQTCALARARGKITTASVTDVFVSCRANATLSSYEGVFALDLNGKRNYLMLLFDGTYSFAARSEDSTCPQNGNGAEYGAYGRSTNGSFSIRMSMTDHNGGCGLWDSQATPNVGASGSMFLSGDSLAVTTPEGSFVLHAVASVPTSLVGAFTRSDGVDGSFIVFEPDGTYLYQEAQDAPSLSIVAGWERGCFTVSGATFTTSLASSCKPGGLPALDLNNRSGFSAFNGASIPFTIDSPTSLTINGRKYRRLVAGG